MSKAQCQMSKWLMSKFSLSGSPMNHLNDTYKKPQNRYVIIIGDTFKLIIRIMFSSDNIVPVMKIPI